VGWADIPSGWSVVVQCPTPWVPIEENGGHECLIAEAYIPVFDPLTSPMDPMDDRHVGQKNEQLVLLAPGASFHSRIHAINVLGLSQALTIEVQPLRLPTIHPLIARRARMFPVQLHPPSAVLPLSFRLSDAPAVYTGPSTLFAGRLLTLARQEVAGTAAAGGAPVQIAHTVHLEPWESRKIEISGHVPENARVGHTYAFRVVQRVGPMVTGGYTVNVVVVSHEHGWMHRYAK